MPLLKESSEDAFWKNYKRLLDEGYSKEQAMAVAARLCREAGGDPSKWLGKKKD